MAAGSIGLQVGIFNGHLDLKTQPEAILDAVVEAGYTAVEYGLDDIVDPTAFRAMLDERNLSLSAVHVTIWAFQDIPAFINKLEILKCNDICNSGILIWSDFTTADFREGARLLNEAGHTLQEHGLFLHYHNHAFEFTPLEDGASGMDVLLHSLDPDAVDFCVDIAWVAKGGIDPKAFLKQQSDRVGYLHLKDYKGEEWVPLGAGEVDIHGVLDILPALSNLRHVVVEQDSTTGDPNEDAAKSCDYLNEALSVQLGK